jgi:hypothetical protein
MSRVEAKEMKWEEIYNRLISSMVERLPLKETITGSSPVSSSTSPEQPPIYEFHHHIQRSQPISIIDAYGDEETEKIRILELFPTHNQAKDAFKAQMQYENTTARHGDLVVENDTTIFYFRSTQNPEKLRGFYFDEIYCPKEKEGSDLHHAVLLPSLYHKKGKIIFR